MPHNDASLVIDVVADPGSRGVAARDVLAAQPAAEPLLAPGHFAFEGLSGLWAAANRPNHPFRPSDLAQALRDAESFEIVIEATPWADVHRAWTLAEGSLRYADAIYVAAAERHGTALLTADARIIRSGAPIGCKISTVGPAEEGPPADQARPATNESEDLDPTLVGARGLGPDPTPAVPSAADARHLAWLSRVASRPAAHDVTCHASGGPG